MTPSTRTPWRTYATMLAVATLGLAVMTVGGAPNSAASPGADPKPTVVLVHGAWADSSSWDAVAERLRQAGYPVTAPPNPLRGVASDSADLANYLGTIAGPIVLVGHSYGGFVTTNAAAASPNVTARVYVDAYIPDTGDSVSTLSANFPGSQVGPDALDFVPTDRGAPEVFIKKARFPQILANDLPHDVATALASSQHSISAAALQEPSQAPVASGVPTFALIGTEDNAIPTATQEYMATRANAEITRIPASHLSLVSHPDQVRDLIVHAAEQTR